MFEKKRGVVIRCSRCKEKRRPKFKKIAGSACGTWNYDFEVKSLLTRSRNMKVKNKPEVKNLLLKKEAAEKNLQLFLQ